ncbi:hypothetical protein P7C71_g5730, partial [Lecanoromycetidae sp. Uapishka_2]
MIFASIAKYAGVLLSLIATSTDADLIIDDTCTTAQKATLNAAFLTAKSVAEKGSIRTDAIDEDDLEASGISIGEVNRVNRLMTAFFAVGATDPNYKSALAGIDCYIFGNDKPFQFGDPGEGICDDDRSGRDKAYSDGGVPDERYLIFCEFGLTLTGWNDLPTTFAGRSADRSAYPGTPLTYQNSKGLWVVEGNGPNTLKYYLNDVSMTMLHEMHHLFLDGIDAVLDTPIDIGTNYYLTKAYGYVGITALANQGFSDAIAGNPDSCVMFALGCYLLGNDWSLNRAWPLPPPLPDLTVQGDQSKRRRRREQGSASHDRRDHRRNDGTKWRYSRKKGLKDTFAGGEKNSDVHNNTQRDIH